MRESEITRNTAETKISIKLNLDGKYNPSNIIDTKIGFFDHMLNLFAKHGNFDLSIICDGDIYVDCHHSMEDIGIALGKAFYDALGDKKGIRRYAHEYVPMDEALVRSALDISGRAYLVFAVNFTAERIGTMETECVEEFFRSFCDNAKITSHIHQLEGKNNHHICEGVFKSFARALGSAVEVISDEIPSTKGVLE
ncbi:MAG: imidazoleglycerol-phosphate dehydratase HisB [Anaerofustis stercorihominis]|nr:imidazoleglycerol-phosphate dehydratase HisB [Anaerofustis stercorihominis]